MVAADTKEYIRMDFYVVPSSRKYDAHRIKERVLEPISQADLSYRLHALHSKSAWAQEFIVPLS